MSSCRSPGYHATVLLPPFDLQCLAHATYVVAAATPYTASVAGGVTAREQTGPAREPGR
jgi:hypothetical protein